MGTRLTIDQLEKMKTHELADLLANVVLLLRRMPDVECKQLEQQVPDYHNGAHPPVEYAPPSTSSYTQEGLEAMNVTKLRTLAKELNVLGYSNKNKKPLIEAILAKSADGRSEQRAMLDMP